MKTGPFLLACALVVAITGHAYAKRHRAPPATFFSIFQVSEANAHVRNPPRHRNRGGHVRHSRRVHVDMVAPVSNFGGNSLVETARSQIGNGPVYGRRNLWCARFLNAMLARAGYKGTGSDLAWSFASLPPSSLHVGAIAVMRHHVGVVSGVTAGGDPVLISGNNLGRVRETVYLRSRVAAFVEAR